MVRRERMRKAQGETKTRTKKGRKSAQERSKRRQCLSRWCVARPANVSMSSSYCKDVRERQQCAKEREMKRKKTHMVKGVALAEACGTRFDVVAAAVDAARLVVLDVARLVVLGAAARSKMSFCAPSCGKLQEAWYPGRASLPSQTTLVGSLYA